MLDVQVTGSYVKEESDVDDPFVPCISDDFYNNTLHVLDQHMTEVDQKLETFRNIAEMLVKTRFSKYLDQNKEVGGITLTSCETRLKSYCERWKDF